MSAPIRGLAKGRTLESHGKNALERLIADVAHQCNVPSSQVEDLYPCTPLQHGLLALSSASTSSNAAYVAQFVFKLEDHIDNGRLQKAWETIIQRNAILRTRIVSQNMTALQAVLKINLVEWGDCTDLPNYLEDVSRRTMQYGETLSHFAISPTRLVWTVHHSVYDGYSVELILKDVAAAYEGKSLSSHTPFKNFVKHIQQVDLAQCRSFWTSRLSIEEVLPFPPIHQSKYRPQPNQTIEHRTQSVVSASSQVTFATIIQAAWGLVLSSRLSSETVSFGLTVNGRNTPVGGIESIVGPTLATVPVCFRINYGKSMAQYLQAVQQYSAQMIPYQHIGLQKIKDYGAVACDFQNLLAIHTGGADGSSYEHLFRHEEERSQKDFFNYAMIVQCSLASKGVLRVHATFDETIIGRLQMERLLFQLEHVIRQLASGNGDRAVKEINLIDPESLDQIKRWNTMPEVASGFPIDDIKQNFGLRPQSTAICSWDGQLTYSELDAHSLKLATRLATEYGVGPEIIVPLCFDRSRWMIVAIIGVMRAGAAFTLLDPAYPIRRLERIIEITGCATPLVSSSCKSMFSNRLVVDETSFDSNYVVPPATNDPELDRSDQVSLHNAMYVVFTSGSTGEPKGVVITHGSYYAGAMAHIPIYELGPQSRNLLFGSPAFDLFIQQTVSTLMAGGCLCVPSKDDQMGHITSVIQSMDVNLASFTSSFARQICAEEVPSLRMLSLGGEALAKDQQEAWADRLCLMNSYGPSECSVVSNIKKGLTKSTDTSNIGRLIVGSSWIVDPYNHNRLAPIGAAGELLIEGPLLGRGYLNDPEKTAASFIENPLWANNPQGKTRRFYKTGDLVRYDLDDGSLLFEGRKDTQIKVRGQRVEIGEVEYHLRKTFPNASGVAVELSKQDEIPQLLAIIFCEVYWNTKLESSKLLPLLANSTISTVSDIKSCLKKALPQHMVPNRYYLVKSMPLLPSGKLDRKQLGREIQKSSESHLELHDSDSTLQYIDGKDRIALRLSERLLEISGKNQRSGVADFARRDLNLSALGLDSIQLISLLSFIRKEFEVRVSIAVLYDDDLYLSGLSRIISNHKFGVTVHDDDRVDLPRQIQNSYDVLLKEPAHPYESTFQSSSVARTVFLTGATGYLGTEILRQLVNDASVKKVIVHVRAENETKAWARIEQAASLARWWSRSHVSRIECWPGDLAEPRLGLSPYQWDVLGGNCTPQERISSIVHNGAAVQWQAPYAALKAANVDSTVALLCRVRRWSSPASFIYVSGGVEVHRAEELDELASRIETNANGYSQTKFVSEQLVLRVAENNKSRVDFRVVKPGLIIGTEAEGVPNADDFLWRFVHACTAIGGYPVAEDDSWLAVTDVSEIAASIIASDSTTETNVPRPLEMVNIEAGLTVDDFWAIVRAELGLMSAIEPMKGEEWVLAIRALLEHAQDDHPYRPLEAMLQESTYSLGSPNVQKAQSHSHVCRAVRKNMRTLLDSGFFSVKSDLETPVQPAWQTTTFSRSGVHRPKAGQIVRMLENGMHSTTVAVR